MRCKECKNTLKQVNETNGLEINLCDKGPVSDIKNDVKDMVSQIQSLKARIDDGNEFVKNCNYAQSKINLDNKYKIFKTHNAFWKNGKYSFTDLENTIGCIYIVALYVVYAQVC